MYTYSTCRLFRPPLYFFSFPHIRSMAWPQLIGTWVSSRIFIHGSSLFFCLFRVSIFFQDIFFFLSRLQRLLFRIVQVTAARTLRIYHAPIPVENWSCFLIAVSRKTFSNKTNNDFFCFRMCGKNKWFNPEKKNGLQRYHGRIMALTSLYPFTRYTTPREIFTSFTSPIWCTYSTRSSS